MVLSDLSPVGAIETPVTSRDMDGHWGTLGTVVWVQLNNLFYWFMWLAIDNGPSTWNMLQIDLHPLSCLTGGDCVVDNY